MARRLSRHRGPENSHWPQASKSILSLDHVQIQTTQGSREIVQIWYRCAKVFGKYQHSCPYSRQHFYDRTGWCCRYRYSIFSKVSILWMHSNSMWIPYQIIYMPRKQDGSTMQDGSIKQTMIWYQVDTNNSKIRTYMNGIKIRSATESFIPKRSYGNCTEVFFIPLIRPSRIALEDRNENFSNENWYSWGPY